MNFRLALMGAAATMGAAFAAIPAEAQYYGGPGGPYYGQGLPPPPYQRPGYGYGGGYGPPPYARPPAYGRIDCGEGAEIVASRGFRNIQVRECSGRVFRYTAFRGRQAFEVRVASSSGQITMVRPL